MRTLSYARKTFLQVLVFTVLEKLSLRKIAPSPNSNANPRPNPDPDRGGGAIFLGGNIPDTTFVNIISY